MSNPGFQEFNLFAARLCTALRAGYGPGAVDGILDELARYAEVRFAEERAWAARQGEAALAVCQGAQQRFCWGLDDLRCSFPEPTGRWRVVAALGFLREWIDGVPRLPCGPDGWHPVVPPPAVAQIPAA